MLRNICFYLFSFSYQTKSSYHPASEASREVANLTERKNLHTPVYGVKEFVFLSVVNFDPNYLRTSKTELAKKSFRLSKAKTHVSNFLFLHKNGR